MNSTRFGTPAFLRLLGDFQLPLCVFVLSHIAIGLAQQVMSHGIVWVHAQGVLESSHGELSPPFFSSTFPIRMYGPVEVASSQMERCSSLSASSNFWMREYASASL